LAAAGLTPTENLFEQLILLQRLQGAGPIFSPEPSTAIGNDPCSLPY
jgi:hypothetical protein